MLFIWPQICEWNYISVVFSSSVYWPLQLFNGWSYFPTHAFYLVTNLRVQQHLNGCQSISPPWSVNWSVILLCSRFLFGYKYANISRSPRSSVHVYQSHHPSVGRSCFLTRTSILPYIHTSIHPYSFFNFGHKSASQSYPRSSICQSFHLSLGRHYFCPDAVSRIRERMACRSRRRSFASEKRNRAHKSAKKVHKFAKKSV